jgi:RNA polymerase sigma-54 factor
MSSLKKAIHEIEKLNPKPWCFTGNNKITENVVPDFANRIDAELELTLNGRNAPFA